MSDPVGLGVEGWWWSVFGSSVVPVESYLPGGVVDGAVVVAAEQGEVVEGGVAAVGPVGEVVGVAHQGWAGAAGEGAVLVAGHEGGPQGGGDQAVGAAEVEDLAGGAVDGGDDLGVAGEPA
jgi:hypothetical protein